VILFCQPAARDVISGLGESSHTYASRMAQALTAIGHPATVAPGPRAGCLVVIDGLLLTTLSIADCVGTVALLDRAAVSNAGTETAWHDRLPVLGGVICTGQATADSVQATFGVTATVVRPGIDKLPATVPASGPVHVLSAGTQTVQEGVELIAALSLLHDLDWTLTIAGSGHDGPAWKSALAAAIPPAMNDRVSIVQHPSRADLDALYARAGLFVVLTRSEAYCEAVAEAYVRGIPVVTTAAGMTDLPLGALLVDADDAGTLSKVLRRTVQDPDLRHSLANAAARAGATLPDWPAQAALFAAAVTHNRGV